MMGIAPSTRYRLSRRGSASQPHASAIRSCADGGVRQGAKGLLLRTGASSTPSEKGARRSATSATGNDIGLSGQGPTGTVVRIVLPAAGFGIVLWWQTLARRCGA